MPLVSGLLFAIIGLGAPIWLAQSAKPLERRPFRWGIWLSLQTALISGGCIATAFLMAGSRGVNEITIVLIGIGGLGMLAGVALYQRMRLGVVLTIASEATFLAVALANARPGQTRAGTMSAMSAMLLLVLMVINVVYFKKRWLLMASSSGPGASGQTGQPERRRTPRSSAPQMYLGRPVTPQTLRRQR